MLKGLYDIDCVTWSPQGKLFQVQYAMQAVKQGSICLGLKSNEYVVLCSLKKLPSELACYQDKMFKVDDYIGMAISGLTADARVLCKYMRNESLNYKLTYGSNQPLNRLIFKIAESRFVFMQNLKLKHKRLPRDHMELVCLQQEQIKMDHIFLRLAPVEITTNTMLTQLGLDLSLLELILKIISLHSTPLIQKSLYFTVWLL